MPAPYIIGLLVLLQLAGCAGVRPAPPTDSTVQGGTVVVERLPPAVEQGQPGTTVLPQHADNPGGTVTIERLPPLPEVVPEVPVAAVSPAPVAPVTAVLPGTPPAPPVPAVTTPPTPTPPAAPVARAPAMNKPAAKTPAKVVAPPPRAQAPQQPPKPPVSTQPPPLALTALEQRLKDTDAIGVFTKIALKNQVDDLLARFRAHYEGGGNTTLAQLRQLYDQLLLKAHGLLKDGDPALASAIMSSREAIWGVLTDPVRFAKL